MKLEAHERAARIAEAPAAAVSQATPVLLFRGLDGGRRAMRLGVVDRIEEVAARAPSSQAAGQLRVQLGEAILPLAGRRSDELARRKVRLFRLNDGAHEIGYAFAEVIDFASIDNDVIPADHPGEVQRRDPDRRRTGRAGRCALAVRHHSARPRGRPSSSSAGLPADDPWMQNMLRPIVEAAGYRVIGDDDERNADLVIASQGDESPRRRRADHLAARRS